MGPRGAGRRLNDQERMEILDILAREAKVKNVDLAKRYGVSEGAIRKLKQVKDRIRDRYVLGNEHNRDKRKRGGFARNAQFEQELYQWICRMREAQAYQLLPLTQTAVRQQAMLLAQKYECMGTFKASPGWFARFCSRHRLDPPMTNSTSGAPPTASAPAVASVADEAKATDAAAVAAAVFQLPALPDADADALMADVKTDAEVGTIDEQTKLAARQHNIVALGIATAAAAAAAVSTEVGTMVTTEGSVTAEGVVVAAVSSVAAPAEDAGDVVEGKASTTEAESEQKAPASSVAESVATTAAASADAASSTTVEVVSAAAVAPSTEDEIFSLGL